MEIILLEKIPNLGSLGDKVTVRPGYGRNFLIPHGKAVAATPEKIKQFEERRAELEKKAAEVLAAAESRAASIAAISVTIAHKAGTKVVCTVPSERVILLMRRLLRVSRLKRAKFVFLTAQFVKLAIMKSVSSCTAMSLPF